MVTEKEMILNFPREIKIQCLKDALAQGEFGVFLGLSKILLDAPLNVGGLESEVIEQIHKEYL
ncbi:MAG: hypothetical protein WC346_03960 [Methanogenium sp.]|jgi:hypothetical protein